MKKQLFFFIILSLLITSSHIIAQTQPALTDKQVNNWFAKKEWLGGVPLQPHKTINRVELARQYQLNQSYWDKAFAFLKNNNLETLGTGKYAIDGDNVYAMVTENPTKNPDSTKWESHKNYIDLQSVISGEEQIGLAQVANLTVTMPYDASKDVANYSGDGKFYDALPGTFFLFFPNDAHRPNITTNGNKPDKKIVIKIRFTE